MQSHSWAPKWLPKIPLVSSRRGDADGMILRSDGLTEVAYIASLLDVPTGISMSLQAPRQSDPQHFRRHSLLDERRPLAPASTLFAMRFAPCRPFTFFTAPDGR